MCRCRTRTQLAERRETKAGNERQQSRDAELERRELGKQSGKLKAMKADEERKEAAASWRKEKAETEAARERVRAQIAQDRCVNEGQGGALGGGGGWWGERVHTQITQDSH